MTLNCGTLWASVSEVIRQRISADGYERWFQGVDVVSDDGLKLVFRVPNPIHQFFIESNYLRLVQDAAQEVLRSPGRSNLLLPGIRKASLARSHLRVLTIHRHEAWLPSVRRDQALRDESPKYLRNLRGRIKQPICAWGRYRCGKVSFQELQPTLCLWRSGLGKTHLLQAIGHYVISSHKSSRVVYLSSEQFTNEFIDAIQHGTLVKFQKSTAMRTS